MGQYRIHKGHVPQILSSVLIYNDKQSQCSDKEYAPQVPSLCCTACPQGYQAPNKGSNRCDLKQTINNDDQTTKNQQIGSPTTPSSNDKNQIEEEQSDHTVMIIFVVIGIIVMIGGVFWVFGGKQTRGECVRAKKVIKKILTLKGLTFFSFSVYLSYSNNRNNSSNQSEPRCNTT